MINQSDKQAAAFDGATSNTIKKQIQATKSRHKTSRYKLDTLFVTIAVLATANQFLLCLSQAPQDAAFDDSPTTAAAAAAAAGNPDVVSALATTEVPGDATPTSTPALSNRLIATETNADAEQPPTTTTEPQAEAVAAAGSPETTTPTTSVNERPASKGKIPPVNFTLVDELFNSVLEEPEVARRWRKMDKTLTEGVRAILKLIFPHIVSLSSDAKVSGNCSGAILKWILNLRNMRSWAVQMLDAIGKPNAGLLKGSLTLFGNYKQCLAVRAPDEDEIEIVEEFREYFRGKYCVLQLKPALTSRQPFYSLNSTIDGLIRHSYKSYEKTTYDELSELAMAFNFVSIRADLCVPSLCSRDDIQRVADFLMSKVEMRAKVQRCDVQPMDDESMIDQSHLLWSMIFVIVLLLVLVSTLTNVILKLNSKRNSKASVKNVNSILTSMSLYRSLSHMKNVHMDRINDSKPAFLYSLRLIIIIWIFLVSLASEMEFQFLRELLPLRDFIMAWPLQIIVNSTLQFETLIFLTAFTYSYQNIGSNIQDLIKYNIGKYSRLMPSIMLFAAITIVTPLLYQNKSPIWHDFVDEPAQVCKSNGFINLFFIQNFLESSKICLPQTWLFCVELQLCILAIPIVYAMNRSFDTNQGKFKATSKPIITLIVLALIGCVINFAQTYSNSLPAAWFLTFPDKQDKHFYNTIYLYKTWTHLTTFSIGLFAGHLCRCKTIATFSGQPYGRKCCDNLMWATSSIIMTLLIYCTHTWSLSGRSHLDSPIASAAYAACAPLLWSLAWLILLFNLTVPSEKNQQSFIVTLLTSDINLIRLGRLAFLGYLINPYVTKFVFALQTSAIFSSDIILAYTFIGNLVITFAVSFVVSALVELPCRRLAKKLLIGTRRQSSNLDIMSRGIGQQYYSNRPNRTRSTDSSSDSYTSQNQPISQKEALANQAAVMIPLA